MAATRRTTSVRKSAAKTGAAASRKATGTAGAKKWSAGVMVHSNALDLEENIFKSRSAKAIAASLKRSAENSTRRKAGPFQSAMSMLNFYINRGGKNLSASRKATLNRAKEELRRLFDRPA